MLFTAMPMVQDQIVQPVRVAMKRRTLREELEDRGVRVISSEKVRAYQRKMVKQERAKAGIWGKFWIFAYWFETSPVFCTMFCLSCTVSLMFLMFAWLVSFAVWGGAVAIVAMHTLFLYLRCAHREESVLAATHWRRVLVGIPGRYSEMYLPLHAQNICSHARQIPEVRVFVEALKDDPLMIACRSCGFWRKGEECVIAFWDAPGFDPD